jgi:site-specific DNA recombinase
MQSTNGYGSRKAILYARVSTDEQARSGYSLAQQMEVLREYACREGYEILEEVVDPGQSGASLERPGMDRVRDLVAAGGVSVVLAQDRDRFAREPAYHYLLRREFEDRGCKIRALNDRGDDSPEGELTDGILDQLAKYERAKVAERTRRGRLRRAREGKIVPGNLPDYGFRFNAARDNYEVDEEIMGIVRRMFYLVGVEGAPMYRVKKIFEGEGIRSPQGKRFWNSYFIRTRILDDVYRPHTYDEISELLAPEVAARLDPTKSYGVCWFNRRRTRRVQVSEPGPNGRLYRKRGKVTLKQKDEWIAVPVPDAGIPLEWVDAARRAIENNYRPSSAGHRFWELSGGIFRCGGCGRRMYTNSVKPERGQYYYRCPSRLHNGADVCPVSKNYRADEVERDVWGLVSGLLKDTERMSTGIEAMISQEREGLRGDPDQDARAWSERVTEADRMRVGYQEMAARGLMTFEELGTRLQELENIRRTAKQEIEVLRERHKRVEELERNRDDLLASYAVMVPQALDGLEAEERHKIYRALRLHVTANVDRSVGVSGAFGLDLNDDTPGVSTVETTSSSS